MGELETEGAEGALAARDVASVRPKGLGESAHHDVYVLGVHPRPLRAPPARLPQGPYAVRLVQKQVRLQAIPSVSALFLPSTEAGSLPPCLSHLSCVDRSTPYLALELHKFLVKLTMKRGNQKGVLPC